MYKEYYNKQQQHSSIISAISAVAITKIDLEDSMNF